MSSYLLDTNHLARVVDPRSGILSRLRRELAAGAAIATCVPVLCELEAGIQQVQNPVRYRAALDRALARLRIWPLDRRTAVLNGELYNELRGRGRVLSQVDMMVAALSKQFGAIVLTPDGDFDAIPGLHREKWLS